VTVAASVHAPRESGPTAEGFDDPSVDRCTARMVAGDRTAYEALFRERCGFVEAESVRRLGRRRDLADDVAQEAWLRIARRPCRCSSAASLDAWLRRVVRSAAIDLLRSELARRVAEDRHESVAFLADHDLLEEIRREAAGIAGLTDHERSIFELKVRADATITQLAAMLGLGRAAVDSTLRRAAERARAMRNHP
jgi:RNA polymerase sigma-70 factor (ECF subfamily)